MINMLGWYLIFLWVTSHPPLVFLYVTPFIMGYLKYKYKEKIDIKFTIINFLIYIVSIFWIITMTIIGDFNNIGLIILIVLIGITTSFIWGLVKKNNKKIILFIIMIHMIILLVTLPGGMVLLGMIDGGLVIPSY